MNKRIISFIFAALSLAVTAKAQDATTWRGPGSTGIYPENGLLRSWPSEGPQLLWHYDDLGDGFSSPVFANEKIYISAAEDNKGFIYALNPDGKLEWKASYGEEWIENYPGARATPTVCGDKLYIYSGTGVLTCLNTSNGSVNWKKDIIKDYEGANINWGVTETVVIEGDKVYITCGGPVNNIVALNRNNGQLVWSSKGVGEKPAYCTPVIVKLQSRKLLVTMTEKHIIGLDAETGVTLWSYEHINQWAVQANTPVFYENSLFCFSGYGQGGERLDLNADGSQVTKVWFSKKVDSRMGGAVILNGYIYGSGDNTRDWQCTDWKTGEQKYASQAIAKGNVIAADGMLFCYSERGELALVPATPQGFNIAGKTKVELGSGQHWAHLVIHDGRLYVRHGKSLIAYKIK